MGNVSGTSFSGSPDPVDPEKRIRPCSAHQEAKTFHLRYYMEKVSRTGFSGFPDPVDPEKRIRPFGVHQEAKTFHLIYYMNKSVLDRFFRIFRIRNRKSGKLRILHEPPGQDEAIGTPYVPAAGLDLQIPTDIAAI